MEKKHFYVVKFAAETEFPRGGKTIWCHTFNFILNVWFAQFVLKGEKVRQESERDLWTPLLLLFVVRSILNQLALRQSSDPFGFLSSCCLEWLTALHTGLIDRRQYILTYSIDRQRAGTTRRIYLLTLKTLIKLAVEFLLKVKPSACASGTFNKPQKLKLA